MRKIVGLLLASLFLFSAKPVLREVYTLERYIQLQGKYYFTPMAVSENAVAFAYVSKVKPTEEEFKAAQERLRKIVDEGIKRQYGSYENYYKEMEKIGEEAGEEYKKEAPGIIKDIMPPSFIKEGVPFFTKAMILLAKNLPYFSTPIGNLGETGVVIVHRDLSTTAVKLGLNEPVDSMDFSPDGKLLAVLTDLSYEDKGGKTHIVGKVSLIETATGKVLAQWIFKSVRREVKFTPDGKIALLYYPWDWKKERKIFFIDTGTLKVEDRALVTKFYNGTGGVGSVTVKWPVLKFSPSGKYMAVMCSPGILKVFKYPELTLYFETPAGYGPWFFSPDEKYLLVSSGKLWDLTTRNLVGEIGKSIGMKRFPGILDARFKGDRLYITDGIGFLRLLSLPSLHQIRQSGFYSKISLINLSPDGKYVVSLYSTEKEPRLVNYGKRLRLEKSVVKVLDEGTFNLIQLIEDLTPSALNTTFLGDKLLVSDFEGIRVYREKNGGLQ